MKKTRCITAIFAISIAGGLLELPAQEGKVSPKPRSAENVVEDNQVETPLEGANPARLQTLQTLLAMLPKYHLSHRAPNKEIAAAWLQNYLRMFDGNKMYFLQSDIQRFDDRQDKLLQPTADGAAALAYDVVKTLRQRVDERTESLGKLIQAKWDFTADEEVTVGFDAATFPENEASAREAFRKRIKLELLQSKLRGLTLEKAQQSVLKRYAGIRSKPHHFTDGEIWEFLLLALVRAYDAESSYKSPKSIEDYLIDLNSQYEGLGIQINSVDDEIVVERIVPGGPAAKAAQLRAKDRIVAVGQGDAGPLVPVTGLPLSQVVRYMRGKAGTICRLEVLSPGSKETKVLKIIRASLQMQEVRSRIVERGEKSPDVPLRVGCIRVPSLYSSGAGTPTARSATNDVRRILDDPKTGFRATKVDVVVLDFRGNVGGLLSEAVSLPGLFIGTGTVMQVKGADRTVRPYKCDEILTSWDGPLLVLTSSTTGSGTELVTAALQDYGRALIIGDSQTAGEGTIQTSYDVGREFTPGGPAPKFGVALLTSAQCYRITGDSTQIRGVSPDIILPFAGKPVPLQQATSPRLPFDRVAPLERPNSAKLRPEQKQRLRALSEERLAKSSDFARITQELAQAVQARTRTTHALNETKAREQFERTKDELPNANDGPLFEPNWYHDEVIAIAKDYLQLLSQGNQGS